LLAAAIKNKFRVAAIHAGEDYRDWTNYGFERV
jgi:hypothetical protein